PAGLSRAVAALLSDAPLRTSLGEHGRRHVLSTHDVRRTAAAVADVYRDLLCLRPAPRVVPTESRESIHP
ncbi:glycosyltransferase, partial [Streptomyces griseoruber]